MNSETKLPTSLWAQVIEKLGINHTERTHQSLYKIWRLKRQNIDELVENELKRNNGNLIDWDSGDINRIKEVCVQKDSKSQLLPVSSLPLPEPPKTRTNQGKTVNGNRIERSINDETAFSLTPGEWKLAFSSSQKKLNDGWTKLFSEKLESREITCSVSFYRAHVKERKKKMALSIFLVSC